MSIEYGFKSFKFKGPGEEALASLGLIAAGTGRFYSDAPSSNQFYAIQNPSFPALSILEKGGLYKVEFTLMELVYTTLKKLFGGTITGEAPNDSYSAPRDMVDIHGSAEIITDSNLKISIPKAQLVAVFDWNLTRTAVSNIKVALTIELPDLEADMPYTITRVISA
jgi:hypothetical protein